MPAAADILARAARIRLLVLDVDGVMTDGRLIYDNNGGEAKAFHVRDGYGIKQVLALGCEIAVISGRHSAALEHRLQELGIRHALLGREDKLPALRELASAIGLEDLAAVACMGDDVPDLAVMEVCGFAAAPADAHPRVAARADWQASAAGGRGAVREFCDLLVSARTEGAN